MLKCHNDAPACHSNILIGSVKAGQPPCVIAGQVLVGLLPVLHRHELLPCPVVEAATAVALTGEGTQPDFLAAVAGTGHHTALLVSLDIFNHTAIYSEAVKKSRPLKMIKRGQNMIKRVSF